MDDTLKAQIRQSMREKDTEELLAIWKEEDEAEWSDEAYEIVRETLVERGVEPPEIEAADDSTPVGAADDEEMYHNHDRAMAIAAWASTLSWFFLVVAILMLVAAALA